jgi:hypothetical protein
LVNPLLAFLGRDRGETRNQYQQNVLVRNWEVNYRDNHDDYDDRFDDVGSS